MRLRNPLFAPADSERKMAKARASAADAVIYDLEDAVSPPQKPAAREAARQALLAHGGERIIVRINSADTEWYLPDLVSIVPARPEAIYLPKCTGPADLRRLVHHLEALESANGVAQGATKVLLLMTETAASLSDMNYAGISERLIGLCFGAEDLSADFGIAPRLADGAFAAPLAAARAAVVIAAAQAGVPAIDTPFADPGDDVGLKRESLDALHSGFTGKACIHPSQLDLVAETFTPTAERIAWAQALVDHFAAHPDAGVFLIGGKMYDRPHLKGAQRVLASAGR